MTEQLIAGRTFESQLQDVRNLETANGIVRYVEMTPDAPESEVPIMLIAGFGTDIPSTARAAQSLYNEGRSVIMLDRAPIVDRGLPSHDGIDGLQHQIAEDVLNVATASGHEKVDAIVQSEAAIFTTAAALQRPELFRSLVIEAGAGMLGKISPRELAGRVAVDSILGARDYLHHPRQAVTSVRRLFDHVTETGGDYTWREIQSIADSDITHGALQKVRASGTQVAYIHAHADNAMKPNEVGKNIVVDMTNGSPADNVDVVASVANKDAHHNTLLFDEMGINAALAQVRQFEAEKQHAAALAQREVDLVG